jgi:hypothetical protein
MGNGEDTSTVVIALLMDIFITDVGEGIFHE